MNHQRWSVNRWLRRVRIPIFPIIDIKHSGRTSRSPRRNEAVSSVSLVQYKQLSSTRKCSRGGAFLPLLGFRVRQNKPGHHAYAGDHRKPKNGPVAGGGSQWSKIWPAWHSAAAGYRWRTELIRQFSCGEIQWRKRRCFPDSTQTHKTAR